MKEKRKRAFIITAVLILSILCLLCMIFNFERRAVADTYIEYTVQTGDTVWDIASEWTSNNIDVRKVVCEIREINNMDDVLIHSGDILLVPTKYTGE